MTIFLEQLSFPSLVFTVRLCFGVKYVSRATTYCVIAVVEKWQQKIISDLDCLGRVTLQIFVFVILKLLLQAAPRTNFLFKISNYIQNICRVGKELKENYLTLHSIFYCINEWSVEFTKVVHWKFNWVDCGGDSNWLFSKFRPYTRHTI